ncbi:MAG: glucokinase [Bacteroidetes bacterium GWF2_33_16]|nr:MAG: glucokinase [Bacteroidetes bacterium GWE2_32_14]OFY05528.1 MAG: glucokinase [Bacteroidetes bacterium GWF2_33_16]
MQRLAIGIDIGGTNVSYGLVTEDGLVKLKESFPIKEFEEVHSFVDYLSTRINHSLKGLNREDFKLIGVGIGAPNGNYYKGTIEFAPNLKWKGIIPLADLLREKICVPTYLTNDANAAAMGEKIYGGAKNMRDFFMVTLGTGLGSGFFANGQLILGHDGFAGELGHAIVDPNGRQCGCGRKGCLETYASATGIVKTVIESLEKTQEPSVLRKFTIEEITSEKIYKAALENDLIALRAFDFTAKILGLMLANTVAITSPEAIFLFGGLANAGDLIFKPTKAYMEDYLLVIYKNKVEIKPSSLPENDAAILGAAALVWHENPI